MFQKILFPTDFSDVSKKALDYIKEFKTDPAVELIVLHVIDERSFHAIEAFSSGNAADLEREITEGVEKELRKIEEEMERAGFVVKPILQTGIPAREILKTEKKEDVSVIVIGSHGKSNLQEMFMGSVSEKVARKCTKPILIIKR
jgi:nucleotide-binding universal stress UspA family protein